MRDPDTAAADIEELRAASDTTERPSELGQLEISITPRRTPTDDDLERYREMGVDRLILQPGGHRSVDEILGYVDQHAPT